MKNEREMLVEMLEDYMKQGKKFITALELFYAKELKIQEIINYYVWLLENKDKNAQKSLISAIKRGLIG